MPMWAEANLWALSPRVNTRTRVYTFVYTRRTRRVHVVEKRERQHRVYIHRVYTRLVVRPNSVSLNVTAPISPLSTFSSSLPSLSLSLPLARPFSTFERSCEDKSHEAYLRRSRGRTKSGGSVEAKWRKPREGAPSIAIRWSVTRDRETWNDRSIVRRMTSSFKNAPLRIWYRVIGLYILVRVHVGCRVIEYGSRTILPRLMPSRWCIIILHPVLFFGLTCEHLRNCASFSQSYRDAMMPGWSEVDANR